MIAHPQKQTVEPPAVIQQPTLGIVISPAVEEQKIAVNDKDDQTPIVSDEKHGNVRDSVDQVLKFIYYCPIKI